jgi:hypothetical protein
MLKRVESVESTGCESDHRKFGSLSAQSKIKNQKSKMIWLYRRV